MVIMINIFDKSLIENLMNSNEFKGWLLSRRWFGDKSALSNLDFKISINYFNTISEKIFLTIIDVKTKDYSKSYFLPFILYEKIQDILEISEKTKNNILKLTENTFSKKLVVSIESEQKIFTLNLIEAEYCLFFWKKMIFDKDITEKFPILGLNLILYEEQFEDNINMKKVQNLVEASLFPDRYEFLISQLGKGNTTNLLFLLVLSKKKLSREEPISYVLKSYKEYSESLEPSILYIFVKNNFANAPKIYGTINLNKKDIIGIIENVPNIGNLGEIYWNELNNMINNVFGDIRDNFFYLNEASERTKLIKKYCQETIVVSKEIGNYIKDLHKSLILPENKNYTPETVKSENYLNEYTEKLNSMSSELQDIMAQQSKSAFYNLPKISSILIDTKDILEKFRSEFKEPEITIQIVHQDLHMEQILYNKINDKYNFYFIDFEGDPQLTIEEKKYKFPIEKDLASFLRALSYIKFNTLLGFIEKKIANKERFEVAEEILYSTIFRRASRSSKKNEILNIVIKLLNSWENKLMSKILKNIEKNIILINYFYIERALHELQYEILFRPNKIIVPILGLKEIIDKG